MNAGLLVMRTDDIEDCYSPPAEYDLLDTQNNVLRCKHKAQSQVPGLQDSNSPTHARESKNDFHNFNQNLMPMMAPDYQ
jgi:hypothetical protein